MIKSKYFHSKSDLNLIKLHAEGKSQRADQK